MLDFIKNIGPVEWLVILLILVILFGRKIVSGMGRATGETYKEVKNIKKTFTDAVEGEDESDKKKDEA